MNRMVRLSDKERDLLAAIQHRAEVPLTELAAISGMNLTSARYALRTLIDKEVITGIFPFVNLCRLGYNYHVVMFSVSCETPLARAAVVEHITTADKVVWCGEYSGEHRYAMTIAARTPGEVADELSVISKRLGAIINQKEVSTKLKMHFYPNKLLSEQTCKGNPILSYASTPEHVLLDEAQHEILSEMVQGQGLSLRDIGAKLSMPASTVRRKIKRMEEDGIISGYYYGIDTCRLGLQSHVLLVYARGHHPDISQKFQDFCAKHPNTSFFVEAYGSWDYEIGVNCSEPAELTGVIDSIHDLFGSRLTKLRPIQITKQLRRCGYPITQPETLESSDFDHISRNTVTALPRAL